VFANAWARQRDDEIVASLVTKLRPPLLGHALQASDQRPLETTLETILEDVMSEIRWITDLRIDCEIAHEATERKAERTRRLAIWWINGMRILSDAEPPTSAEWAAADGLRLDLCCFWRREVQPTQNRNIQMLLI